MKVVTAIANGNLRVRLTLEAKGEVAALAETINNTTDTLTAYAMREDEHRARAAGFDGYLTKPIDTRTFANQLEAFLSRAKPSKEMLP